jgi:putative membrane protein
MAAMMFWYGGHWAFWQAGMMWAGMIVFWGLLIWGIFALIRFGRRPGEHDQTGEVRRILDERLARGEISPEEHQRILDLLTRPRTRATSHKSS